jgi:MFS family permease
MLVRTDIAAMAIAALLAVNASIARPKLWAIYVLAGAAGGVEGMRAPSGWSILPRLVPADQVPAASALNAMYASAGTLVGPAIGGVLIASVGLPSTFVIDAVTFLASLAALAAMRPVPPAEDAERASLGSIFEGLRFLRRKPVLQGTYLVDYVAMIFGMPRALFPALVLRTFHRGPRVLGLFYAAPAVGSLLASAVSGWSSRIRRQGLAIMLSVIVWGLSIAVLGVTPWAWLGLVAIAVAGGADMVSGIFRMTMWTKLIPDNMRGRVSGIGWINVASGPILGDFEAGVVAAATSVRFSILSGGIACVVGALVLAALMPAFVRYRAGEP